MNWKIITKYVNCPLSRDAAELNIKNVTLMLKKALRFQLLSKMYQPLKNKRNNGDFLKIYKFFEELTSLWIRLLYKKN